MRRRRVAPLSLLLCLSLGAAACGGGGNSIIVVPSNLTATFTPGPASANPRISMEAGSVAAGETFTVEIHANGIVDLYGAAFTLLYDPAQAEYLGCQAQGSILSNPSAANNCNNVVFNGARFAAALQNGTAGMVNGTPGVLNVLATKSSQVAGVANGTGLLLTLTFEALVEIPLPGEAFDFEAGPSREVDTCAPGNPLPPCQMPSVNWDGGVLTAELL